MRRLIPIMALAVFLSACAQKVEYTIMNGSTKELSEVVVTTDSGHCFPHGALMPNIHSSYSGGERLKSRNRVTISWMDSSGSRQEVVVFVSDKEFHDPRSLVLRITESTAVEKQWRFEDNK